jgi:NAD(P)-dependent dehydrogenase (short-subunit alcohol dehydrogenase family)
LALAREGAKVAVAGRRKEKLEETLRELEKRGDGGLAIACDVSQAKDAERAVRETAKIFGKLDVLVNNAGVLHASTIEGITEEQWDKLMTINLKGPFLMCKAALPEFRKAGGGAIVNVGSVLGLVAMKDRAAYCASKGGVTRMKTCGRTASVLRL